MSAPDPESFGLLEKVITAGAVVAAPITWLWAKLDKKADKTTVNKQIQQVNDELLIHRGYFKDVFNQMRENEGKSEERHRELLMHLIERK